MRTYVRPALLLIVVLALAVLAGRGQPTYAWTPVAPLNTNAATDSGLDQLPQVTTDRAGNWVAVWQSYDDLGGTIGTDMDVLVARSTDNGAIWTAPAALNTNAATDSGNDGASVLATDRAGNWVTIWSSSDSLGGTIGTDYDILVARSSDNGASWTAPAVLNTNAATDSGDDGAFGLVTDRTGNWVAVSHSTDDLGGTIGTDYDILVSRSTDNGATWTDPEPLNTNAATDSGFDGQPQVTTDAAGNWVTVWYSTDDLGGTIGTDGDILVARSTDNGATWTPPTALNTNAATDSGDVGQPQVATDGAGNWVAVWWSSDDLSGTIGTDNDILVARSTDYGATWTAPVAVNSDAGTDSAREADPDVATDGAGNWAAVWYSNSSLGGTVGTDRDILVARSTDNGATWTAQAVLNTNATTDSGLDADAQVTTDGAGNWVVAWNSLDSLGGTIGTDRDILYATCSPLDDDCDGIPDSTDSAPLDTFVCQDVDTDTCDDCSLLGVPDPSNDGIDTDDDGACDAGDNCPADYNPGQENSVHPATPEGDHCEDPDADLVFDITDNCPDEANPGQTNTDVVVNPPGDALGDACDPDDDDDSWVDDDEAVITTDPLDNCTDQPGDNDAWPPDMGSGTSGCGIPDTDVNILDVSCYKPKLPPNPYDPRYDLDASGEVNILDVLLYKPLLNTFCP